MMREKAAPLPALHTQLVVDLNVSNISLPKEYMPLFFSCRFYDDTILRVVVGGKGGGGLAQNRYNIVQD